MKRSFQTLGVAGETVRRRALASALAQVIR
jgi:hypothetical protein